MRAGKKALIGFFMGQVMKESGGSANPKLVSDLFEKLLGGGREALAGKEERQGERELRRKVAELERALGRKTYELEMAGKLLREWE